MKHCTSLAQRRTPESRHNGEGSSRAAGPGPATHPTAAVRLRLPVHRMMEAGSACTTVAPSF